MINFNYCRYTKHYCVDAHGTSCFDILTQLNVDKNLIICKKCRTTRNVKEPNVCIDKSISRKPWKPIHLSFPNFSIELLEKR